MIAMWTWRAFVAGVVALALGVALGTCCPCAGASAPTNADGAHGCCAQPPGWRAATSGCCNGPSHAEATTFAPDAPSAGAPLALPPSSVVIVNARAARVVPRALAHALAPPVLRI